MKAFIIAVVAAATLSVGAASAQAQNETDRAMGAGSYLNPNGPATGAWGVSGGRVSKAGAVHIHKVHKAR